MMRCFDRFRNVDGLATVGLLLWLSVSLVATLYELFSSGGDWLHTAGKLANIGFLGLLLALVWLRPAPSAKADGIWPRVSGVAAVALPACASVLPKAEFSPVLVSFSAVLVVARICGAIYVVWWLGRNFSIFAQARGLVGVDLHAGVALCASSFVCGGGFRGAWRAAGLSDAAGFAVVRGDHRQSILADALRRTGFERGFSRL